MAAILAKLGAVVIDADEIGHEAIKPHTEIWQEIVDAFGEQILLSDYKVNRQELSKIVFNDTKALAQLNQIMHPRMYQLAEERIENLKKQGIEVIVLEAAALLEADWTPLVDQVWVTIAEEATMLQRTCQRSGLSETQALARLRSQLPQEEKIKYAQAVINTDCTLEEVEAKVRELWRKLVLRGKMNERIEQILSQRQRRTIENKGLVPAAVLIPFYQKADEHYIVFTKRTERVEYHKGQISFPGGGCQPNENSQTAALRESWEEIGLDPKDVEILGELDEIETISNYVISPFVAAIPYPYEFRKSPEEVEEIIEVPLAALLDKNNIREEIQLQQGKLAPVRSYEYKGQVIWGATARILKQFLELVSE